KPSTASLVINPPCPSPVTRVDFYLPALHPTFPIICVRIILTPRLNTGIRSISLYFAINLQDKIAIFLLGDQERIWCSCRRRPDNHAVFHVIRRFSPKRLPTC